MVEVLSFRNTLLMDTVQATIYGISHLHHSCMRYFPLFSTNPNFFVKLLLSNQRISISYSFQVVHYNFHKTLEILHKINLLWLFDLILQLHLAKARSYFVIPSINFCISGVKSFGATSPSSNMKQTPDSIESCLVHDGILISWLIKNNPGI